MTVHLRIVLYFSIFHLLKEAVCTRWLIESPGFDNANAWESGYLPCADEEVVFPEYYPAILPLPQEVKVKSFVLPRTGALLLSENSEIVLGGVPNNRPCESGSRAYIKAPDVKRWYDPGSWRTTNEAANKGNLLDVERVPCSNDSVVIPSKGPLAIDLQSALFLRIGQMYLAGSILSRSYLQYLLSTDIGQILFQNSLGVAVEYYRNDLCGCHKDLSDVQGTICHNVVEACARPRCLNPVKPLGSCCEICGAVLTFSTEDCFNVNINKVNRVIRKAILDAGLADELDFYVANVPSAYGNLLQAIIVDKDGYNEKSVAFARQLNGTTNWSQVLSPQRYTLQSSGRPYNPNLTFGSILLILLCLMVLLVVGVVILSHYTPNNRYLNRIPQWIHDPRHVRNFLRQRSFIFRRFDNTGANTRSADDQEIQESAAVSYDVRSSSLRERAFDNPMFRDTKHLKEESSKTGGSVPNESSKPKERRTSQSAEIEECSETNEHSEVQELTEIKLVSSSEESGDEAETAE